VCADSRVFGGYSLLGRRAWCRGFQGGERERETDDVWSGLSAGWKSPTLDSTGLSAIVREPLDTAPLIYSGATQLAGAASEAARSCLWRWWWW